MIGIQASIQNVCGILFVTQFHRASPTHPSTRLSPLFPLHLLQLQPESRLLLAHARPLAPFACCLERARRPSPMLLMPITLHIACKGTQVKSHKGAH